MKTLNAVLFIFTLFVFFHEAAAGESIKNQHYRVPEVTTKIKPDGALDEEVWQKALVLKLKYEVEPGENIEPPVKTEVLLAYSRTNLYVAFRAYDPEPANIRARISDRDNIDGQDWVGVILDTFNDERRSYDFLCNPYGVQDDFIETAVGGGSHWDTIWDSGGRITDKGYFVEMSIPFSSLRFQRKNGDQVWGFDAVRSYPRSVVHHIGTFPRDRNNNCYLCQSIKLVGFKGAKPGKNLEFDPTLSAHLFRERDENGEGSFDSDKKLEPGLTTRWGFTPNLTLSVTLNPDFSHVEADEPQLEINQPFALSYSEKRPFFTEGADFFSTRINAVYTRTLRDPSWGVKLTGKEGANTIGAYVVRDTLTNLIFPGNQESNTISLDMDSTATVLRYRRDIGNKYTLGLLFTNRQGEDYFNRVLGFDGDFRFTSKDRVRVQVMGSGTRYPDQVAEAFLQQQGRFNGRVYDIHYFHNTRNLDWYAGYRDMGPNFRADLGFLPQVGYHSLFAGTDCVWYAKPGKWWSRFILEGDYEQLTDPHGQLIIRHGSASLTYLGPMDMYSVLQFSRTREFYKGVKFDLGNFYLHHSMKPTGDLHLWFSARVGGRIDYSNTRLGKRLRLSPGIEYHLGLHLRLNFSHTFERMWVEDQRLYTANQSELRLVYQFNKRTFLRAIVQYLDQRQNTDLYNSKIDPQYNQNHYFTLSPSQIEPHSKYLFTQILFSYKINPQTVLFLGYSDNYTGNQDTGLPQINRTFFLKIGYALVI